LKVTITIQDAWELFQAQHERCALTGVDLTFGGTARNWQSKTASLDRIDSSRGYTKNNVQWIHKRLQWMKNDMPEDEFIAWCKAVAGHSIEKKAAT
jgi:hypothetical protein